MTAHSVMAEQQVLGTMLEANPQIATIRLIVGEEDFYRPSHQEIFRSIVDIHERDGKVDAPTLVQDLQSRGRLKRVGGAAYIGEIYGNVGTAGNVALFATRVRELSRVRRWREVLERGLQVVGETEEGWWRDADKMDAIDMDRLQDQMARVMLQGELLVDEKMNDEVIDGLLDQTGFLATADQARDFVVPDLFERKDVWMVLGGEGSGKSWLSRQFCHCIAAGIHPWFWERPIEPAKTLLIDLENAESMIRRQSRGVAHNAQQLGDQMSWRNNAWIWTRPEGLNLRERHDQLLFQTVLDRVRPDFVALGSLYNAFQKGRDDWESAAEDVKVFFNRMRNRYNFTLLLEHHMPKGDGSDRPQNPYGSSVWMRWVSMGRVMKQVGDNTWTFRPFRGDRDVRQMPVGMSRGGTFAWSPIWDQADIDAVIELEDEIGRRRRNAQRQEDR